MSGMVALIQLLREFPLEITAYAWTSHNQLGLLSENDFSATRWVKVDSVKRPASMMFKVQARVPDRIAPWPHAYTVGEAYTPEEALAMVAAGMAFSEGWKEILPSH